MSSILFKFNGILASCYSHPDYDKDKEPRGDNAGTPFADELVTAVHINFPSMFDTIGPHIYGLQAEQNKRVLDALGEYDRQAKICADNIAKNIRRVQTCHARVSDHIVSIIRGAMQTQETAQRAGTYTEKQPTFQGEPAAMPSNQEDVPKLDDTAPQSRTPPSTAVMECLVNTTVIPDSTVRIVPRTGGPLMPSLQNPGDLVIPEGQQQADPDANLVCHPNYTSTDDIHACHHGVQQTDTSHMPPPVSYHTVLQPVGKTTLPVIEAISSSGRIDDARRIGPATPHPFIPPCDITHDDIHTDHISQGTDRITSFIHAL